MDNQKVLAQVLKSLSDRWDMTVSEVAEKLNKMSEDEVKNVVEMTKLFEKGGKLNYLLCLKKGGIADCGCGAKVVKDEQPAEKLRAKGRAKAYTGNIRPDFIGNEGAWNRRNGAWVMNVFDGNDLHQNVVTIGEYGTPRRAVRIIRNYNLPEKSDTLYQDATGVVSGRNPSAWKKLFGEVHSEKYMNRMDNILRGYEPMYTSEREVRANKNKK